VIARGSWDSLAMRVERNCEAIFEMFAEAEVSAAFFTLGWVAKRESISVPGRSTRASRAGLARADAMNAPFLAVRGALWRADLSTIRGECVAGGDRFL
jgi:hypothetical protein